MIRVFPRLFLLIILISLAGPAFANMPPPMGWDEFFYEDPLTPGRKFFTLGPTSFTGTVVPGLLLFVSFVFAGVFVGRRFKK